MKHYWKTEGAGLNTYHFNIEFTDFTALEKYLGELLERHPDGIRHLYEGEIVYAVNIEKYGYSTAETLRSIETWKRR